MTLPGAEGRRELVAIALAAAREAGALVHAAWRTRPPAERKGRTEIVTRFDRESEQLLRDRLARATSFAIVGEEAGAGDGDPPADGEPVWFVDPIDGTTNFVHGHPFYCVSIGLVMGTAAVLGVVVAPALGVEWTGVVGAGARRNGAPCAVSEVASFSDSLLATGFPYDRAVSEDNNFDAFVAIKRKCQAVRRCGSAALDLCLVADGTYDGYWEKKLAPWDCAGGAALVVAAGGRVSDYAGGEADVLSGQLLATNGAIHDALVHELQSVPSSHLPPAPRYLRATKPPR
jgi:myo-inositol-1(or 4)-monophosphatase